MNSLDQRKVILYNYEMIQEILKDNDSRVIAPFGYFGSKHRIADLIVKELPPHYAWVEAFCGSASITLAKPAAPIEIINDVNNEIVNFFQQLRDNCEDLCAQIFLTPYARVELAHARKNGKPLTELERARRFLVSSMMAINGIFGEDKGGFSYSQAYARNGREARVSRWCNLPDRLKKVVKRLKNVRIENVDAIDLLKKFSNRPATLVYLDPPYLADRTRGYDNDQNCKKFHTELLKIACKAKCMILISGYDNDLYHEELKRKNGWIAQKIATHTQGTNGKRFTRTEFLWQNKYCAKAKKLGRPPIRLTLREKKLGKLNPSR